ncbi:M1-specific T cell receptor alpha chain-like isoform X7 [Megalobrama amblycephala]|uniref:M1-specific T cell receptor alpha chain-like isoform X7 n=1 Tax=Megalobrama amblycephala TaxID=75352 RepID=UPI00201426E0|nr:M1-specific T cell receptor alpha chain-like isoform X7 [Megalobrama amblycephala]
MTEDVSAAYGSYDHTNNHCVNSNNDKIIFGKGTQLYVQANEPKEPDYYKLGESCLATDFTNHSEVKFGSVTPVRYTGKTYEKFYSSFAFKVGEDACDEKDGCKGGSSGQSDMEFDEKINFMSLGLFWLRILLLKTVVFNILMTFKAWMS